MNTTVLHFAQSKKHEELAQRCIETLIAQGLLESHNKEQAVEAIKPVISADPR
jgi:hypothetical protein